MNCQGWIEKTRVFLSPFETENLLKYLTLKSAFGNPWVIGIFSIVLVFGIVKRSKFILLSLFTIIALLLLIQYVLPKEGGEMGVSSLAPFMLGGMFIAGVIIYFTFIKSD